MKIRTLFRKEIFRSDNEMTIQKVLCIGCSDQRKEKSIKNEYLTVTGYDLPTYSSIVFEMDGDFFRHSQYGEQFKVSHYQEIVEDTKKSILSYLSSGIISGIGEKTAKKIYQKFGNETMHILDHDIERLSEIRGISGKKLERIKQSYREKRGARELLQYLIPCGIPAKRAIKVYEKFGTDAVIILQNNIYSLCSVNGFSFPEADRIAKLQQRDMNSQDRFREAVLHCLKMSEKNGHVGMQVDEFGDRLLSLLGNAEKDAVNKVFGNMLRNKEVIFARTYDERHQVEKELFCRSVIYFAESFVAEDIARRACSMSKVTVTFEDIKQSESRLGVTLHKMQRKAVFESLNSNFSVLTGGPGTGKSATLNVLYEILENQYPELSIVLLSPTGKAARHMEEATGHAAYTIHAFLGLNSETELSEDQEYSQNLSADICIVDESSMADVYHFMHLLKALPDAVFVIVGDHDQLPSVGPGQCLKDIIEAGICPVTVLTKIYRQAEESMIIHNSVLIKNGKDVEYGNDFRYSPALSDEECVSKIRQLYQEKAKEYGKDNLFCLLPMRKGITGIHNMNAVLQDAMQENARKSVPFRGGKIYEADRIMHLVNTGDLSNGDVGLVSYIGKDEDGWYLDCNYDGIKMHYSENLFGEIELAYAMTIHKSQGSQKKCVIIGMMDSMKCMLSRNLLYTACTRAEQEVIIVGQQEAVSYAVRNEGVKRNTLLREKLRYFAKKIEESNPFVNH